MVILSDHPLKAFEANFSLRSFGPAVVCLLGTGFSGHAKGTGFKTESSRSALAVAENTGDTVSPKLVNPKIDLQRFRLMTSGYLM